MQCVWCVHTLTEFNKYFCTYFLGYRGVASFCKSNTTYTMPSKNRRSDISSFIPGIIKAVQCIGNEQNPGQCLIEVAGSIIPKLFKGLPPGATETVKDVGWVSCTGNSASHYHVVVTASLTVISFHYRRSTHLYGPSMCSTVP